MLTLSIASELDSDIGFAESSFVTCAQIVFGYGSLGPPLSFISPDWIGHRRFSHGSIRQSWRIEKRMSYGLLKKVNHFRRPVNLFKYRVKSLRFLRSPISKRVNFFRFSQSIPKFCHRNQVEPFPWPSRDNPRQYSREHRKNILTSSYHSRFPLWRYNYRH